MDSDLYSSFPAWLPPHLPARGMNACFIRLLTEAGDYCISMAEYGLGYKDTNLSHCFAFMHISFTTIPIHMNIHTKLQPGLHLSAGSNPFQPLTSQQLGSGELRYWRQIDSCRPPSLASRRLMGLLAKSPCSTLKFMQTHHLRESYKRISAPLRRGMSPAHYHTHLPQRRWRSRFHYIQSQRGLWSW